MRVFNIGDDEAGQLELPAVQPPIEPAAGEQAPDPTPEEIAAAKLEQHRNRLLQASESFGTLDTIQERVAWILNHYPETRDSDRPLWFRYWSVFESDHWDGRSVTLTEAQELTHPGSLTRARALIQNRFRLFLASDEVRARRGTLADEERDRARAQAAPTPLLSVFADESGKGAERLIVGSVWFLHAPEIIKMMRDIEAVKLEHNFTGELHFAEINGGNLPFYLAAAQAIAESGAAVSFKAVRVERRGIGRQDQAFEDLFYHLLVRGLDHEHRTGRAPFPRRIALLKDREEIGRDNLMMANLRDRVSGAAAAQFGGEVQTDEFASEVSERHQLLQVADLYASSINRRVNVRGDRAKDVFAREFLRLLGTPDGPADAEQAGDLAVHLAL